MEWVAVFHLPEVFIPPHHHETSFSLARTWGHGSRWVPFPVLGRARPARNPFDSGSWPVEVPEGSGGIPGGLASPLFARKKDPVFEMEYQGVAAGWESSEIVWGILKVHGNRSVWSICSVYQFCFCVIQDRNKGGRAGNSNSLFFTQGRIC